VSASATNRRRVESRAAHSSGTAAPLLLRRLRLLLLLLLLLRTRVLLGHELLRPLLDCFETVCHLPELALEVLLFLCELEDGGGPLGQGVSLLSPAGTARASI